jgi:hypothetical protein
VLGMVPRVLVVPSRLPLIIQGRWLGIVRFSGCDWSLSLAARSARAAEDCTGYGSGFRVFVPETS